MTRVVAWIVALEGYGGPASSGELDFPAHIARRAIEWAEWVRAEHPEATLLLNVSLRKGATQQERDRLEALRLQAANAEGPTPRAGIEALHDSLARVRSGQHDLLILVWMGHGVMKDSERFLLHEGSTGLEVVRCWRVGGLLQSLRHAQAPEVQIGLFDACADHGIPFPGDESPAGDGAASRAQHFHFSAVAGAQASLSPEEPTASSVALEAMRAVDWPPQPQVFIQRFRSLAATKLPLRPIDWASTDNGSGEQLNPVHLRHDSKRAEVDAAAKQAGVSAAQLRHLWAARSGLPLSAKELAAALHLQQLDALVARFSPQRPADAVVLSQAVSAVRRISPWVPRLRRLGLGPGRWVELVEFLADRDGAQAPPFDEESGLMLWALDIAGGAGDPPAEERLLRLLLMAVRSAPPAATAAAQELRQAIADDAVFAPLVQAVEATTVLPQQPVVMAVRLEMVARDGGPRIAQYWVMRDRHFGPPEACDLQGPFARQLRLLAQRVGAQSPGRPLRVELLAPTGALLVDPAWLTDPGDEDDDLGGVEVDWMVPITWRSIERLQGDARWYPGTWRAEAPKVRQRALARGRLSCRFADDHDADALDPPPLLTESTVRGIAATPARGAQGSVRKSFFAEILKGYPYMVWPVGAPADPRALKKTVRNWFAGQTLEQLPEAYKRARREGSLPALVVFVDEPERDPFAQLAPPGAGTP